MVTRRTVIGTGIAFASLTCSAAFGASGPTEQRQLRARAFDALLIDDSIEMPAQMNAFIEASRRLLPVVKIQLDAAAQPALRRFLGASRTILGISSGASLFCLERIAWDHGLRLTGRNQRRGSDWGADACRRHVDAFLSAAYPPAANPSLLARTYRPSRADGLLHAWVMQKIASPQLGQGRREV
jgi:hypothetical protein